MTNTKMISALIITAATVIACSSEPPVVELSNTADPQAELATLNANINNAQGRQLDVISPNNFNEAQKARDKAVEARAKNKDQTDILHQIAVSQAYLNRAEQVATVANEVLKGPIEARHDALVTKAEKYYPKETSRADLDLKKLTDKIEDNDTSIDPGE